MKARPFKALAALVMSIAMLFVSIGCMYDQDYQRCQRLLVMYPPGKATRADVRTRFDVDPPREAATRPADGWGRFQYSWLREKIAAVEQRSGQTVYKVDVYLGPRDLASLCHYLFFYNGHDRVIDVECEPASD